MACPSAKLWMHRYSQYSEDGGRQGRIHVEFSHLLCSKAMKGRGRMLAILACSVADTTDDESSLEVGSETVTEI